MGHRGVAVVIFLTGLPLAYHSCRYNLDLDLITRGSGGRGSFSLGSVFLAARVCLSLIAQIAEQIDHLRFMPPR